MRDTQVLQHMSPQALRALAHYYECTAEILRRRADHFDPPPRPNREAEMQIFLRMPDIVAEIARRGEPLDRAIELASVETGTTRERVEQALAAGRRREKAALKDLRRQQAFAMRLAGASNIEIGRALGVSPQYAGRLAMRSGHGCGS